MIDKVAMFRAGKYVGVKKEVEEIMGGQILNYEAKDIRNKALREGRAEGILQGENLLGRLVNLLVEKGRIDDVARASTDPEVRQQLYREFHLI